jgi:hypothetical protein
MAFLHYSEYDVRRLLSRVIPLRWPREALLFLARCHAERSLRLRDGQPQIEEMPTEPSSVELHRGLRSASWRYPERLSTYRRGYLAATQSRLIYHDRTTAGSLLYGTSAIVAGIAIAVLLFGQDLMGWLVAGTIALSLWIAAHVVEAITAGNVDVEFEQVLHVEDGTQRMVALGRANDVYTIRIDDPSDFRRVAALVGGLGNVA